MSSDQDSGDDEVLLSRPVLAGGEATEAPPGVAFSTDAVKDSAPLCAKQRGTTKNKIPRSALRLGGPDPGDVGATPRDAARQKELECEGAAQAPTSSELSPSEVSATSAAAAVAVAASRQEDQKPSPWTWAGPSWWDTYCLVQHGHAETVLSIKMKGVGLRDADVASVTLALDSLVARLAPPGLPISVELDASDNNLSDVGGMCFLHWVWRLLRRHESGAHLKILKLYRNRLGDATCEVLAEVLYHQLAPAEEIHLSHNAVQQHGFAAILAALALHPASVYPRETRCDAVPCWVRLEHNEVANVDELLAALSADPVRLRSCFATRSPGGPSCSSFQCCKTDGDTNTTAHVHLYCVREQSTPSNFVRDIPAMLAHKYCEELPKGSKLQNNDASSRLARGPSSELSSDLTRPEGLVSCREVELRVDRDCGAGLELEVDAHGYMVGAVDVKPGQDLSVGDVILEIDGNLLWGIADEECLAAAFGHRFANGASLRVAEQAAVRGRAVLQPIGLGKGSVGDAAPSQCHAGLGERCGGLRQALREDLAILGERCGLQARPALREHDLGGAILLQGPPVAQRWAVEELRCLITFYFPELATARALPPCEWWGEADPLCEAPVASADIAVAGDDPLPGAQAVPDLGFWEQCLRKQWSEDDDRDDEDLPCEPLEAPDEGPDVFDGGMLVPTFYLDRPLRVIMLVGLPGSGKSTLAARLAKKGWDVINQDTLGDRRACTAAARAVLASGGRVVIDRCNISRIQRRVWLGIADECESCVGCIWLDVDKDECGSRVLKRFNHPSLPAERSSLAVIDSFHESLESPVEAEGFVLWRARCQDELESAVDDVLELAEFSGASDKCRAAAWEVGRPRPSGRSADPGFRYRDTRERSARSAYLRSVRRQVEYYFCDVNLRQDWFFQEKLAEEPEVGWLELRWILSCPRIKNVHKAGVEDVLEALGPSMLLVKESGGVHWLRRGRPPPALLEKRPAKGEEPAWYNELHGTAPSASPATDAVIAVADSDGGPKSFSDDSDEPRCAACGQTKARESFSKAQLTKHRKNPVCKDCVAG